MKTMKLTVVTLITLFALVSLGWADKVEIPLGGAALIASDMGQRVVVKVNLTGLPQKAVVDYAEVRFAQDLGVSTKDLFGVWVQALTKTWDPGSVSWTVPWTTPGGDFGSENVMVIPVLYIPPLTTSVPPWVIPVKIGGVVSMIKVIHPEFPKVSST